MLGHQSGVGTRIPAVGSGGALRVLAPGRAVPVHLIVGEPTALVGLAEEAAQIRAGLGEDVHARVDDRRSRSVGMLDHNCRPSPPAGGPEEPASGPNEFFGAVNRTPSL